MSFEINSINWLFKYKDGWEDYFQTIKLYAPNKENHIQLGHHQVFEEFSVREYKAAIKDIYIYNDSTKEYIQCIKNKLNLVDKEYDSIFIRRGDKLGGESDYIKTEAYIEVLLQKNSNCRTIFLQTDDYNCILDANQYMRDHNLNINIITLCQENSKGGVMVFRKNQAGVEEALCEHKKNQDYISLVIDNLRNSIAVDDMSPNEIYDHTMTMLSGIDIVLQSNISVCEYSSNVSRFIKLAHWNGDNVYNVNSPDKDIDMNIMKCPSFSLT